MLAFLNGNSLSDGPMEANVIGAAQGLLKRLFRPPGWQPRTTGPQGMFPRIMAVPDEYTVSTDMILRLAGYIVNEGE